MECEKGELKIGNTKNIRRIQIRAENSYMVITPNTTEVTVTLPTTLILAERQLEVTAWDNYENYNTSTVICPPVEFCARLEYCWICVEELINPQCRPIKSLLWLSNLICIAYILIHK
uniref:Uncharacterized protein n=1 Tax=Panagrolaimus superbus TaxID=310955 RepID=A0A914XWV1_9BILA